MKIRQHLSLLFISEYGINNNIEMNKTKTAWLKRPRITKKNNKKDNISTKHENGSDKKRRFVKTTFYVKIV